MFILSECNNIVIQVSFFSTSPELSNKARFEYFTRTIPSDLHQVRAMVAIVKQLGWRYVSIVYEESNYGIKVTAQSARSHFQYTGDHVSFFAGIRGT